MRHQHACVLPERRALRACQPCRAGRCGWGYTVDLDAPRKLAHQLRPRLITIGMSLNLFPHPVREIRANADEIGALVLFDDAHRCGMIAGGVFANPLAEGAHLMAMNTYESLGGPAGGLVVTNADALAEALAAEVADWRQGFDPLHVNHP